MYLVFCHCHSHNHSHTLDSEINVAPPLKNFHITILTLFYINLGIAVIFDFIFSSIFFSKINKRTPTFIPESRVDETQQRVLRAYCPDIYTVT